MPARILNSIVFVGSDFKADLFDERDLCEGGFGPLDKEPIKAGPIGRFSYSGSKYEFWIAPDRIDIRCHDTDIIPSSLLKVTTQQIIAVLEPIKKAVQVSGVGINCDAILTPREIGGREGGDFCRALTDTAFSQVFLPEQPFNAAVTYSFAKGDLRCNIRIEPEATSQGRNLFLAFNGHQSVTVADSLEGKLEVADSIRDEVRALYSRLGKMSKTGPKGE